MNFLMKTKIPALPRAIFFDIDNTIYPYLPAHKKASQTVQKKATSLYMVAENEFYEAFEEARKQIKTQLGDTASSHSRLLYYQRTLELLGLSSEILTALDLEQSYWRTFLLEAKLFDDVIETFNAIRLHGIPLVFVTDLTAQIQMRKIIHFGLDKYCDYVVTSEESGADKMHPASYKLALKKLGFTSGVFWMVGDNPVTDIGGARQAIDAITFQKLHKGVERSANHLPDVSFSHFSELLALISETASRSK
ncbi:Pyrophosphatase PpaX [Rhodobacteraceae bacterium LE17]|jgi:putative hydrolase of the HAD superfamily|nr:Pyrophosphatase PpaX [Rhodobacteraceae bacterium LE17]